MSAHGPPDVGLFVSPNVRTARAYEELAETVRNRIIQGELRPGARLPSETAMAHEAQLSRSTVREAMRILQEGGYIERLSPKVMVVRQQSDERAHEELRYAMRRRNVTFDRLHEALYFLEPELTALAASRGDAAALNELEQCVEAQEQHTRDFAIWNKLDQEFHLKIASMSANPALILARTPITQLLMPALRRSTQAESHTLEALEHHRQILEAIRRRDPAAASLIVKRHINAFRKRWERSGFDPSGRVGDDPGGD